jgi:hypothetical protein
MGKYVHGTVSWLNPGGKVQEKMKLLSTQREKKLRSNKSNQFDY